MRVPNKLKSQLIAEGSVIDYKTSKGKDLKVQITKSINHSKWHGWHWTGKVVEGDKARMNAVLHIPYPKPEQVNE